MLPVINLLHCVLEGSPCIHHWLRYSSLRQKCIIEECIYSFEWLNGITMYVPEISRRFSSVYRRGPCSKLQILSVSMYHVQQYALRAPCLPLLEVYQICDTASVSFSYALSYNHRSRKFSVSWPWYAVGH